MINNGLRIAIIEPVGGHGGMDYYDFGLCRGLASVGIDVALYTCDETAISSDINFKVRWNYVGIYGNISAWRRGLRYLYGTVLAIITACMEGRRICHFHFFHVGLLQAFNIGFARLMGRRIVITAHDVESLIDGLDIPVLNRLVYSFADRVIAHNRITEKELIKRIGLSDKNISVIPHGNYTHTSSIFPSQLYARKVLNIPDTAKVILFFGRIKAVKGLCLLLNAMPRVLNKHPDAILLIAGKPLNDDFSAYESQISRLGISTQCRTYIRYISDTDRSLLFSAANLVTLPYLRIYQSGVMLMAMSYAKAVLVSDLPGMLEIITEGENGFVFRNGDVSDLVKKIDEALSNTAIRDRIANNGYLHVRDNYDWNTIAAKTKILYDSINN